jgi:GNAT superfamily N-acetyltransferase
MTTEIRQLSLDEVAELLLWAKAEGWNPGIDDAAPFHAADPAGFLGCFVDGNMAAGISAVASGPDFGFIGLYICHPNFRGRGYGRRVWDAGMAQLGNRTIGLDGVPAQQENYRRMGFEPAYRTWRYSGRFLPTNATTATVAIGADLISAVSEFDRQCYPGPRQEFLSRWLGAPRIARAIIRDGHVVAYGVLRKCHDGYKIGPLFAETEGDAGLIFVALCACSNGETISIDVPERAASFSAYLDDLAFDRGFETMRMYRGSAPDIPLSRVFGVTTLELG